MSETLNLNTSLFIGHFSIIINNVNVSFYEASRMFINAVIETWFRLQLVSNGKIIAEPKELIRIGRKMFTSKIRTRHWVLFILLMAALILSLVALALYMGEQYHVMAEEFKLVFRLSILVLIILLLIGIKCLGRWRRRK